MALDPILVYIELLFAIRYKTSAQVKGLERLTSLGLPADGCHASLGKHTFDQGRRHSDGLFTKPMPTLVIRQLPWAEPEG